MSRGQLAAGWPDLVFHDDPEEIQEDDIRAYASHPDGEFEVVFNSSVVVDTVFIYRESSLLDGLVPFSASRQDVLSQFGQPSMSGDEQEDKYLGLQGAWDRFDCDDWSLHFQYQPGQNQIKQITVMTAQVARRVSETKQG